MTVTETQIQAITDQLDLYVDKLKYYKQEGHEKMTALFHGRILGAINIISMLTLPIDTQKYINQL